MMECKNIMRPFSIVLYIYFLYKKQPFGKKVGPKIYFLVFYSKESLYLSFSANFVLFPKKIKYLFAKAYCFGFICFNTFKRTFIIIPTCHIRLCVYFLVLYNFSNLSIVVFTSSNVVYFIFIVSFGFLSIYTSNDFLGFSGLYKNCFFVVFTCFVVFTFFCFLCFFFIFFLLYFS